MLCYNIMINEIAAMPHFFTAKPTLFTRSAAVRLLLSLLPIALLCAALGWAISP